MILRVGYGPQAIEVSDAVLVNFGGGVDLASLPHSRQTYGGSEPDAPWRAAANERIEKYRTGQLEIRVMDRDSEPVPEAQVNVELIRHAFGFGSALSAHRFPGGRGASDAGPYLERATELFNWGVMENAIKWPLAEDKYFQDQIETALAGMQEHDSTIRGHTLSWPSFSRAPQSLESFADQPDRLRPMIETRP